MLPVPIDLWEEVLFVTMFPALRTRNLDGWMDGLESLKNLRLTSSGVLSVGSQIIEEKAQYSSLREGVA